MALGLLYIDMFDFQNTLFQNVPGLNHCCIFVPIKKACKTDTDSQLTIEFSSERNSLFFENRKCSTYKFNHHLNCKKA